MRYTAISSLLLQCLLMMGTLCIQPVLAENAPEAPPAAAPAPQTPAAPQPVPEMKAVAIKRAELIVRQLSDLQFGTFASEQGGGTITVSPSNARTTMGNISLLNTGTSGAAEYEVIGQPGEIVTIFLPDRASLGKNGGSGGLTLINLTSNPRDTLTLDTQGRGRIRVGGTLQVAGNMSSGSYNGAFDIDVRYLR